MLSLKSKKADSSDDIMPYELWKMPAPIVDLVAGYAVDTPWMINKSIFFSDVDCTLQQILFLAEHAGPLDKFKYLVESLIEKEILFNKVKKSAETYALIDRTFTLGNRQGTLVQCLVTGLDQTLKNKDGTVIDEGMVECFINIISKLLPHKLPVVLEQAQLAMGLKPDKYIAILKKIALAQQLQCGASTENINAENKSADNSTAIKALFDVFIQGNEDKSKRAIENFQFFLFEHGILVDHLDTYYANLINLIETFEEELMRRRKNGELSDDSNSINKTDRLLIEIINFLKDSMSSAATHQLFDAFTLKNENNIKQKIEAEQKNEKSKQEIEETIKLEIEKSITEAIHTFEQFVEKTKLLSVNEQNYLINNQFYTNHIYLIHRLLDDLIYRDELRGSFYGKNANRLCIEVIGGVLQKNFPPHVRQLFGHENGILGILNKQQKALRTMDVDGQLFHGKGSDTLGANYYFSIFGKRSYWLRRGTSFIGGLTIDALFEVYYRQLQQPDFALKSQQNLVCLP